MLPQGEIRASLTQTLNIPSWVEEICRGWIRLPQVMLHKPVTHSCLNLQRTFSLQCARSKIKQSNFSSHAYYCKLTCNDDYFVGVTRFKSSQVSNSSIEGRETYFEMPSVILNYRTLLKSHVWKLSLWKNAFNEAKSFIRTIR